MCNTEWPACGNVARASQPVSFFEREHGLSSTGSDRRGIQRKKNMKYLLLIYMDEKAMSEAEREQCYKDSTNLAEDLFANGQFLGANPLQSVATATSVRIRGGKRLVTDGPFAETREQLGGYFLVDAGDLDTAIAIAARIPGARKGTVEIRPVIDIPGLPTQGADAGSARISSQ